MQVTTGFKFMLDERDEKIEHLQDAQVDLVSAAQLFLDWHAMDTKEFVGKYGKYGHEISTKTMGDRFRAAIAKAQET